MTRPETGAPYASWVFLALVAITPLAAYLWPFGLAAFTPIAAIMLIPVFRGGRPDAAWMALLAFGLYALVATLWSPVFAAQAPIADYADAERQTWGKVAMNLGLYAVLVSTAARLPKVTMRRLAVVFMIGTTALAAVLLLESLWGARLYHMLTEASGNGMRPDLERRNVAQGTYALALMYWPAVTLLRREDYRALAVVLTAGTLAAPILLHAWAPAVAVLAGGVAYVVARWTGRRAGLIIGGAMAAAILVAPWVVLAAGDLLEWAAPHMGTSWAARLDLWAFAAEQTLQHPIFGWGLDASRAFQPFMLHPHSAPLQVWLELGLVGAVLLAVVWFVVSQRAMWLGPQALAAAVSYFVIGALSFGMWQEWWLGLAAMTAVWVMVADDRLAPKFTSMIEA